MSLIEKLKHAFATNGSEPLSEQDKALLRRVAVFIVQRKLAEPAILFLESIKPLNFLGSQALHFLAPFATFVFNHAEYERFSTLLERRETLAMLVELIEAELARTNQTPPAKDANHDQT